MNPLNYGSLEASKRLVAAGIVLETDYVWYLQTDGDWRLAPKHDVGHLWRVLSIDMLPAPTMAEVWRELPGEISYEYALDVTKIGQDTQAIYSKIDIFDCYCTKGKGSGGNSNPTDALIDLLIWQRKEANHA